MGWNFYSCSLKLQAAIITRRFLQYTTVKVKIKYFKVNLLILEWDSTTFLIVFYMCKQIILNNLQVTRRSSMLCKLVKREEFILYYECVYVCMYSNSTQYSQKVSQAYLNTHRKWVKSPQYLRKVEQLTSFNAESLYTQHYRSSTSKNLNYFEQQQSLSCPFFQPT